MGQRISIQYSIDVDELPENVVRLLFNAVTELRDLSVTDELTQETSDTVMTLETVNRIDTLRQSLGRIDFMLADVNNLVSSYINYQTRPSEQEGPQQEPQQELPVQNLQDLQDKIDLFRKNIADDTVSDNEVTS
jgi:hypothetical protein